LSKVGIELSDVIDHYMAQNGNNRLYSYHLKTLHALRRCRTLELGGHVDGCDSCGHMRISYNSCRNRHCPKCQGLNKEMWIIGQEDMLLPVLYYHVVFTLPHELNLLCMYDPRQMYDLLFSSAWHTLRMLSEDPQWIGARPAATMLLHTWSQTLQLHPHVHCIVPNGGLTKDGQWQYPKKGKGNFLFPVLAMTKVYKGYFMSNLIQQIKTGELSMPKGYFKEYGGFKKWKRMLYDKNWVVYTKKPFSGVQHVIDYLGRYSHSVAITNRRIISILDGKVRFTYKDYREDGAKKEMDIAVGEFIRRFCLHLLPPGYRKVRYYGFISNASKAKSIALARRSLGQKHQSLLSRSLRKEKAIQRLTGLQNMYQCPCCKKGIMKKLMTLPMNRPPPEEIIEKIKTQRAKK